MPTGLEIPAMVAFGVGSAVSAVGSVVSGYAQRQALDYNARVAELHADAAERSSDLEAEGIRKRTMRVQGAVRARAAGAGLDVSSGSPLDILAENASEGELDALVARYSGAVEASRARSQATLSRFQGSQAVTSGWIGAGAELLRSAGSAYRLYGPFGRSGGGELTDSLSGGLPLDSTGRIRGGYRP